MKHPAVRFLLTLSLGVGALWLAFRGQDFDALLEAFQRAKISYILLGTLLMFASHLVRAWRWQVFLYPVKRPTSLWTAYRALMAGYGMNNVIPRSAEIVRPFIFARKENLYMSGIIASILVERVMDLITLMTFVIVAFLVYDTELARAFPTLMQGSSLILGGLFVVLILALTLLFSEQKTLSLIHRFTSKLPERFRVPIEHSAGVFSQGLHGVRTTSPFLVILGTLGIWVFYSLSMYVSFFAFDEMVGIGFAGAVLLRIISGVAFLIPTPGGTGSYHFFISQALILLFGVEANLSLTYATLTHASNYLIGTILGLVFLLTVGVSATDLGALVRRKPKTTNEPAAALPTPAK